MFERAARNPRTMPLARYVVARFGGPPTGTTSSTP